MRRLANSVDALARQLESQRLENRIEAARASVAARSMFRTSLFGVVFAFMAACGAVASAVYAFEQVREARTEEVRQNRAYMYVQPTPPRLGNFPVPVTGTAVVDDLIFRDGGATPAYQLTTVTRHELLHGPLTGSIEAHNKDMPPASLRATAYAFKDEGVGQHVAVLMSADSVENLLANKEHLFLWGEAGWSDVFHITHWLHYCYVIGVAERNDAASTGSLGETNCSSYNDSDEKDD